jgi:hypothetical protein
MKRQAFFAALVCLFVMLVGPVGAQDVALAMSTNKTIVDGVVKTGEYSFSKDFGPLTLFANRTADVLTLAVTGSTSGWVAVGLGSLKMNGATIFMGFVDDAGKVQFKPQLGSGHKHGDAAQSADATVISYAIKTAGGKTTLELALKPNVYITKGQTTLDLIFAVGQAKSFIPLHSFRGALSLSLS